jgi:hypothetical protein
MEDYANLDEEWEFPPGSVVKCEYEMHQGKNVLIARELAQE